MRDPVVMAAARLEAAVEKLAIVLERPRPDSQGLPRAQVAELAARLDATIARLRHALAEEQRSAAAEE